MITLQDKIKNDLDSSVNNFALLYNITSGGKNYYLSTQSVTLDGIYYDDIIMKVGGAKESIDLRTKKVRLGNSSITINNAPIDGRRFTDTIQGEMFGGKVDVYLQTQSCTTLEECIKVSSLVITGVQHDDSTLQISCEDRYIDEFHKELPLAEHTLYEGVNTFAADNEKRIPILYGHLKNAPAVVYLDNNEGESSFSDDNVTILPDRAYIDDYDIVGIKSNSPYLGVEGAKNQLIDQDVLKIKLGDHAATVYSSAPDRLHRELIEGNEKFNNEYSTKWKTQFEVSEQKDHARLLTSSIDSASENITTGNLLCGEVSKLINSKAYITKMLRPDSQLFETAEDLVDKNHYTLSSNEINSPDVNAENVDMLSLEACQGHAGYWDELHYNNENYVFNLANGVWTFVTGTHFSFDIPSIELEFEGLKSTIDKSEGKEEDTFTDANLITKFYHKASVQSDSTFEASDISHWEYCFFPQRANYDSENTENKPYFDPVTPHTQIGDVEVSTDILGLPPLAYQGFTDYEGDQIDGLNNLDFLQLSLKGFTDRISNSAPLRVFSKYSDYDNRHTFHTIADDYDDANTWINKYQLSDQVDWASQNIYTSVALPKFDTTTYAGQDKLRLLYQAFFSGIMLKRTWYQKNSFDKNFFLNAKGKFNIMPNEPVLFTGTTDEHGTIINIENADLTYFSNETDVDDENTARETNNNLFFSYYDYLTKDRFKKYHTLNSQYELVISATYTQGNNTSNLVMFDIEVNDFRVEHLTDQMLYKMSINSKVFRDIDEDDISDIFPWYFFDGFEGNITDHSFEELRLRYAKPIKENGVIISWEFLDEVESETTNPFKVSITRNEIGVQVIDGDTFGVSGEGMSVKMFGDTYDIPTVANTSIDSVKELIQKPSDVIEDLMRRELGLLDEESVEKRNLTDDRYELDFSLYKAEDGIDVMQKIAQCSPFFYKNKLSDGTPSVIGIKHAYDINDVDKKINVNQILKYKYSKTKKQDVVLKTRVKYGFDYVKEEYTKVTPDVEHDSLVKQDYIDYYNINDEESYTLEHEAPYIQDKATAEILAKHLFELHKNQHTNVSFQLPLIDSVELEVGDIVSFTDNNGRLTNINNTKPYGFDLSSQVNFVNDQAAYSFFMITSIKKDLVKSDIQVTQLHYLQPHSYEEANPFLWDQGDQTETNTLPTVQILNAPSVLSLVDGGGLGSITLGYSDQDANDSVVEYAYKVTNTNGDILLNYDQTRTALDPLQSIVIFSLDYNQFGEGAYNIFFKVYDSTGAGSNPASITTNVFDFAFADPIINLSTQAYNSSGEIILANAGSSGRPATVNVPHNPSWMMIYASANSNLPNDEMTFDWDITPEPIQQINYPSGNVGLILEPDTTYTSICTGTNVVGNSTEVQTTINVGEEIIEEPLVLSNLATELVFFEDVGTHVGWSIRQDYEFYYREEDNSYHIFKDDYESFIEIRESLKETKSLLSDNILIWTKAQYPEYGTLDAPEDHYSSNTYQPIRDMDTNMPSGEYWDREISTYSRNVPLRLDWAFTNEEWMSFYNEGNPIARYVNTLEDGTTSELNLYVHPYMTSAQFLAQEGDIE